MQNDERIAVVFCGEGGSQNGRMAECLNAAAKESLPILFVVIDNGRAINTFTPDVATNSDVFSQVWVSRKMAILAFLDSLSFQIVRLTMHACGFHLRSG